MRIATTQIFQRGLDSMLDQQARVFKTQLQLSSGQRFTSPADDPSAAAQILGLNESLAITGQYRTNAKAAQARLDTEETALRGVINALQRARELAVQGRNDSYNAADRAGMAQEVRQLMDQMQSLANTRDSNGEYIFAGFQSQIQPFTHDGSGGFTYAGDQGQRLLQIGPARQIAVSDSGLDVFMKIDNAAGTGYQDVFSTLYTMATDLEANSPSTDRITEIDNAIENILQVQARIGARQNAIDREDEVNSSYAVQLETARGNLRDIDIAEAATDLNRQLLVLQSAQQSFVRIQGLSLFNYL
jgi:flagellar hook-associated protein 3 FlgL